MAFPSSTPRMPMDEIDRPTWARRFAARLRARSTRLTPEEALSEGDSLFGILGSDLSPEEAADALTKRDDEA